MRIVTLGCGCTLALLAIGPCAAFDAVAQQVVAGMGGAPSSGGWSGGMGAPVKSFSTPFAASDEDPVRGSARSMKCAQRADAQSLEARARKVFLHKCKRGS